jgi:hypothetical protein
MIRSYSRSLLFSRSLLLCQQSSRFLSDVPVGGGSSSSGALVKHVVMFQVREDVPVEQVEAMKHGLLNLWTKIPWMQSYELGQDLQLPGGQNHPAGKNRTICWSATFEDVDSYERYDQHPDHVNCVNELIKPIIVPGSRAAIQYELKR